MDLLTTLYVAIFFFIMGAAIVGLVWYLRGISQRLHKGAKSSTAGDWSLSEMARLMRHLQTQELVVEMDGKEFTSFNDLSPTQQRRLTFTSNVLSKWIAMPSSDQQQDGEPVEPLPEPVLETSMPFDAQPVVSQESYIPPFIGEPLPEVKPISADLPNMVDSFLNPTPPTPAFKSIAEQINELLQARLVGAGLDARGITLRDAPDRGVLVTLDGKQYNSVMDVPDENVRNIIRDAVVEWESTK